MKLRNIKIAIALVFCSALVTAVAAPAFGYPPFLAKAKKFGAKDCTFCHVQPEGGPPFAPRGEWLVAEKERRKADVVNPEWLADYKPGEAAKAEKPAEPSKGADAVKVDAKVLDSYVGRYELPIFVLAITKEGDRLFGQPEGDTKEELTPESETEFKVERVNAKVKFVKDDKGEVTGIVVTLNGQEIQGKRLK
jgi:hypothetical protein